MNNPKELKYAKTHEWVKKEEEVYTVGLTDFAQDALGDIVFVNLPEVGDAVTSGEAFCDVESVKAVSDVFSPVTGVVCAVNEELLDNPALINEDCYGAWLIKVNEVTEEEELLDAEEYEKVCAEIFIQLCREKRIDFHISKIGSYWNGSTEIDVVAVDNHSKTIFAGECKFYDRPVDIRVYSALTEKCRTISEFSGYRMIYGLFSKSGFDERVIELSEQNKSIILINKEQTMIVE